MPVGLPSIETSRIGRDLTYPSTRNRHRIILVEDDVVGHGSKKRGMTETLAEELEHHPRRNDVHKCGTRDVEPVGVMTLLQFRTRDEGIAVLHIYQDPLHRQAECAGNVEDLLNSRNRCQSPY